jgi:hypothetical protein
MNLSQKFLALGTVFALGACAAPPMQEAGELSEDGLQRLTGTTFDEVWVRPGVDLRRFEAIALEEANVYYRDVEDGLRQRSPRLRTSEVAFAIPEDQRNRIERSFETSLAEALDNSEHFRRAPDPARDTLAVRASLVDFVSRVPREGGIGRTQIYVDSVGEATLVIELWDPQRNELLARAIDHQRLGPPGHQLVRGNQVTSWAEINRQMRRWGGDVRSLLDELHDRQGG